MANEQNLIPGNAPGGHKLTVEESKKGGKASGKARREKATIQKLLNDYLDKDIKKDPLLKPLGEQMGLKGNASIKQLVTVKCVINALEKGDLSALAQLQALLGEEKGENDGGVTIIDDL